MKSARKTASSRSTSSDDVSVTASLGTTTTKDSDIQSGESEQPDMSECSPKNRVRVASPGSGISATAFLTAHSRWMLILAALVLCSCEPTLQRRVFEYERQVNAGNVDRALALFADDATVRAQGMHSLTGKDALRGLAEWDSVVHTRLTFYDMVTEGDTVLASAVESNDWLAALGIEEIFHPTTLVVFQNGLITRFESETDSSDARAMHQSLDAVLQWALQERPHVVRTLVSDAGFRYNSESAGRWLQLLREWRDAVGEGF